MRVDVSRVAFREVHPADPSPEPAPAALQLFERTNRPALAAPGLPRPSRLERADDHRPGEPSYFNFRAFADRRMSASSQFDRAGLDAIVARLGRDPKQMIFVDLRQESHGFAPDGAAISWRATSDHNWANRFKSNRACEEDERARLILEGGQSEAQACKDVGALYQRYLVTDHLKPDDKVVDAFVELLRAYEDKDVWFHFHCKAGKGRTTTFLVLKEIFDRRHEPVSLETIVRRHADAGGVDLFARRGRQQDYKHGFHRARGRLIRDFYTYCHATEMDVPFSVWRSSREGRTMLHASAARSRPRTSAPAQSESR